MIQSSSHESDLNYSIQITRFILRLIGAWPVPSNSSPLQKVLQRILNITCYILFLFFLIPVLLHMFLKEKSTWVRLKLVGPVFNCMMSVTKYTFLLYRDKEIKNLIREMKVDWKNVEGAENRRIMLSQAKIGRGLVLLSAIFMYGGGLSYRTIVPLSKGRIVTSHNVTIRSLACPSYFLKFDEQLSPAYEIVFALQFFAGFVVYSVTIGVCGLAAFFIMHVCGQLRILIKDMSRLTEGTKVREDIVEQQIAKIVEHQMKAKRFLKRIEEITEHLCLVEIVGYTFLVCLVGYYAIMEWKESDAAAVLTYSVILISFAFCIFIFCYIGQLLDNESQDVSLTCKMLDWYRLPVRKVRCLILIIAMSSHPMRITAGKMMYMSLNTFTNLMKTAVGFFNILRTVTV